MITKTFSLLVGTLATIIFAAIFLFIFANSVQMVCQRQPDETYTCVIEKSLFGKLTTSRRIVSGITSAQTVQSCDSDGCSYRTELATTDGGSVPFDEVYTDHDPVAQITDKINTSIRQADGGSFAVAAPIQIWLLVLISGLSLMSLLIRGLLFLMNLFRWAAKQR